MEGKYFYNRDLKTHNNRCLSSQAAAGVQHLRFYDQGAYADVALFRDAIIGFQIAQFMILGGREWRGVRISSSTNSKHITLLSPWNSCLSSQAAAGVQLRRFPDQGAYADVTLF